MLKEEAQEIIDKVCAELCVRKPRLYWTRAAKNGKYRTRDETVSVSPHCWRGTQSTLLHELAHHVSWVEAKLLSRPFPNHSPIFWRWLWRIAEVYYGDPRRYHWETEYPTGIKFGRSLGLDSEGREAQT